ncbi:MAG: GTPase RsgA, partial [Clostridia bacterium]|nr:GTPase RsgA [Clostridia bacterium]
MKGLVTKKQANKFWVENKQTFVCTAQKKLKSNGIFVGDFVEFDEKESQILKLLPRKNKLLRPPVANIDALIILITSAPQPDFYLLDKLLLFCGVNGIEPIICHSKSD